MKTFISHPVSRIVLLFLSFVLAAFILGGFVLNGLLRLPPQLANTVVIAVIVLITLKAYKREGKSLSELGLGLTSRHLKLFFSGLLLGGVFIIPLVYAVAWIKGYPVIFNPGFDPQYVISGLWLLAPTVILEELAFRGKCFKDSVELIGVKKANIVFASVFIISHWLNMNAFGNIPQMTVLLITGLGHFLYAAALLRSKSLYFPIGIHLGNNWATLFVFNGAAAGEAKGTVGHSLVNVVSGIEMPTPDTEFFLSTLVTAAFFLVFALLLQHRKTLKHEAI